ncbi:hypothetical protein Verru16b_00269 [Lacunisphaera limnophila]|uniref:Uncharacterized protein n=2 Tax=Lacunisphaera limnophila TaxID=1838286 RepID=A0A1I7PHX7_9BACT|nr:hypothetical protein Verru16b_00269 [Lacunisphaera limnophila]
MRLPLLFLLLPLVAAADPVWRPFSADSPWNTPLPADAAVDRDSPALIADLADRGPWLINIKDWSIPVYFVDAATTPRHDVGDLRPGIYGKGFAFPRQIPIPDGAIASPPVGDHSDNHLSVIDRTLGLEWGMWAARQDATGRWFTGLGAVTDLTGTGVAPPWYDNPRELDSHRARAGGFPLIAGLIRVDEIKAGRIAHALAFAYDHCRTGLFVPPASTSQVTQLEAVDSRGIPMGGRLQLDPAWDVEGSGLSPAGKIIARALQEYGAYCSDYAGANVLYAENSPAAVQAWAGLLDPHDLAVIFNPDFIRQHFRVIDLGTLLPGQNLSVPPPYLLSLSFAGEIARIDPYARTILLPAADLAGPAVWRTLPAGAQLDLGGSGWAQATRLILTAPDGATSTWTIQRL